MRLPATGAENRARTDTKSPSRDFKSLASANSAIPAFLCIFGVLLLRVCSAQASGTSRSASANSAIPACRFCLRLRNDKGGIRRIPPLFLEAPSRLELENEGFADLCLTTWLWCHSLFICTRASECRPRRMKSVNAVRVFFGAGDGIAALLFSHLHLIFISVCPLGGSSRRVLRTADPGPHPDGLSSSSDEVGQRCACLFWSGRRDSDPRLSPWQGDTLPLSHSRMSIALY